MRRIGNRDREIAALPGLPNEFRAFNPTDRQDRFDQRRLNRRLTANTPRDVLTEKELTEEAAYRKKREKYWSKPASWDYEDFSIFPARFTEWDYHPTGQLSFELEHTYLMGASPRRSYRDVKVKRLEMMAIDIAAGIKVLAAARKEDRLRREEDARQREEELQRRESVLRQKHIDEGRSKALDGLLEEMASLDRLRRLVSSLRAELEAVASARVAVLVTFAEEKLARRELALSADGLKRRLEESRLFAEDDDHDFRPPAYY